MREEAEVLYYGLQFLATNPEKLGPDQLFTQRAACVPPVEWTWSMWRETARIVGTYLQTAMDEDVQLMPTVQSMRHEGPVGQAHTDARMATPRPSPEQIGEVQELAAKLRSIKVAAPQSDDITVAELDRINKELAWSRALEQASSCDNPDKYPPVLIATLRTLNLEGIRWLTDQPSVATTP